MQSKKEVKKLLAECYEKAKKIVGEHLDTMDKIAQFLIEKETITGAEFMKIYREAENLPEPTEEEKEAAKAKRLYATRAESAKVGENVPVKKKNEEVPKEEGPKEETPADGPLFKETESIFTTPVQNEETKDNDENQDDQPNVGGGTFSHVPNDFDK